MTELERLPGGRRIARGLEDLAAGAVTADSLLVAIASLRLAEAGLPIACRPQLAADPEIELYRLLCASAEDPYYAYKAALAELDSFLAAIEARRARETARADALRAAE